MFSGILSILKNVGKSVLPFVKDFAKPIVDIGKEMFSDVFNEGRQTLQEVAKSGIQTLGQKARGAINTIGEMGSRQQIQTMGQKGIRQPMMQRRNQIDIDQENYRFNYKQQIRDNKLNQQLSQQRIIFPMITPDRFQQRLNLIQQQPINRMQQIQEDYQPQSEFMQDEQQDDNFADEQEQLPFERDEYPLQKKIKTMFT